MGLLDNNLLGPYCRCDYLPNCLAKLGPGSASIIRPAAAKIRKVRAGNSGRDPNKPRV
jgi:hypothetical protein